MMRNLDGVVAEMIEGTRHIRTERTEVVAPLQSRFRNLLGNLRQLATLEATAVSHENSSCQGVEDLHEKKETQEVKLQEHR